MSRRIAVLAFLMADAGACATTRDGTESPALASDDAGATADAAPLPPRPTADGPAPSFAREAPVDVPPRGALPADARPVDVASLRSDDAGDPGTGTFVATGSGGTRLWSLDGRRWIQVEPLLDATGAPAADGDNPYLLRALCFGGGQFLTGSHQGWVWTSPDGRVWRLVYQGRSVSFEACAYGRGTFTAGVRASDDAGAHWQPTTPEVQALAIAWSGDVFLAVADGRLYRSADGKAWAAVAGLAGVVHVVAAAGRFVAISDGGRTLDESADGVTWSARAIADPAPAGFLGRVAVHGAGRLLVIAEGGMLSRPDGGDVWRFAAAKLPVAPYVWSAAGDAHIVVLPVRKTVYYTSDGATWTEAEIAGDPARRFNLGQVTHGAAEPGRLPTR